MATQAGLWWWAAAGALALAVLAGLAEWRRTKRRDLDRPGWAPWPLIHILATLAALVAFALALKA